MFLKGPGKGWSASPSLSLLCSYGFLEREAGCFPAGLSVPKGGDGLFTALTGRAGRRWGRIDSRSPVGGAGGWTIETPVRASGRGRRRGSRAQTRVRRRARGIVGTGARGAPGGTVTAARRPPRAAPGQGSHVLAAGAGPVQEGAGPVQEGAGSGDLAGWGAGASGRLPMVLPRRAARRRQVPGRGPAPRPLARPLRTPAGGRPWRPARRAEG